MVHGMLRFAMVLLLLQRPSMADSIEDTANQTGVANDLGNGGCQPTCDQVLTFLQNIVARTFTVEDMKGTSSGVRRKLECPVRMSLDYGETVVNLRGLGEEMGCGRLAGWRLNELSSGVRSFKFDYEIWTLVPSSTTLPPPKTSDWNGGLLR